MSFDGAALDLLPDPTVVVDGDGCTVHATPMALRLLGRGVDEVIGKLASELFPLVDEAGLDWWDCTRPLEPSPELLPRIAETDLTLTAADGRSRPIVLTGARHRRGDDAILLVLSLRRGERRRRLDAARSDLVSTVSHELRSPLTSVKGFTKTLLAKWDRFTDEQKRQMLATVNEDADRVTLLLGELLDVSRIDAGRLSLRRQMIDVHDIVGKVVERISAAHDGGERVFADPATTPTRTYADPDKLGQVLTNLVENGLKYGAGEVRIAVEGSDDLIAVTITDQGAGIEQAHLTHIFTKFFRRPGERRTGTGLGLYISKGIVEAHGGRIWAESADGAGATFHFTIPRGGLELGGVPVEATAAPVPEKA